MQTAVTIFLAVTVAALAIVLTLVTTKFVDLCQQVEADNSESRIETLIQDKEKLLLDNITLQEKNDELYSDNVKLTEAVKELREINKALMQEPVVTDNNVGSKSLLPTGHTNTYRCEDYHLFNPKSEQYRLQQGCTTSPITGIRLFSVFTGTNRYEKYYCAAMGGAFGTDIGHAYKVKLKCGTEFNVILADFKHPIDNVRDDDYGDADTNYDGQACTCVIEFVVDMARVPDKVKQAGTMSALDMFGGLYGDGGDIVEITDLGKVW